MSAKKPWHGIMTVLHIHHWRRGEVVWENHHIPNMLHSQGEEYIVNALFTGGRESTVIPDVYYIGLDNREVIDVDDTMDSIFLEPTTGGYSRQPIASSGDFTVTRTGGMWTAVSPLLVFASDANAQGWGPVQNLFLTNEPANDGVLISSTKIGDILVLGPQEAVTLQLSMSLRDCPPTLPSS